MPTAFNSNPVVEMCKRDSYLDMLDTLLQGDEVDPVDYVWANLDLDTMTATVPE